MISPVLRNVLVWRTGAKRSRSESRVERSVGRCCIFLGGRLSFDGLRGDWYGMVWYGMIGFVLS